MWESFYRAWQRPLGRVMIQAVGASAVAGVAFHHAMEHTLNTRPQPTLRRQGPELYDPFDPHTTGAGLSEDEQRSRQLVRNQNENFRRFLRDLPYKDRATRLEEASTAFQYFVNPTLAAQDIYITRRTKHPMSEPDDERPTTGQDGGVEGLGGEKGRS